ncbi:zinc ribbon domain-containing protein [Desulfobacterales bacterium HSG17]|nr:zinc ribbon domain-containing protein [Desulfobacterales bacterium HSG17]
MPIYEYECEQCGKLEEALQKISDAPLSICRYCSGSLHKLMSQNSFHLKGSGWYVTDYANKSKDNKKAVDKKAEPVAAKTDTAVKSKEKTS